MVECRWVYAAMHFTSIEFSFDPCKFAAIVPGAYPGEAKSAKNVLKWQTFELTDRITALPLQTGVLNGFLFSFFH